MGRPAFAFIPDPRRSLIARVALILAAALIALAVGSALLYSFAFGPAGETTVTQDVLVHPGETTTEIGSDLLAAGLVRHDWAFEIASFITGTSAIRPGGYKVSPDMDVWTVLHVLSQAPYFAWVTIPEGLRKEQIADIIAETLGWNDEQKAEWFAAQSISPDFAEGVYYADTYLIPSDQSPADVAARLRAKFQDMFASYAAQATTEGIAWGDVLTLASLVERESAKSDKALVAGILWNRIHKGMNLQVDATLQYAIGNEENGWWPVPTSADKYVDSPFNTYEHAGLPPSPIANPSIASVEAVLDPDPTTCLYYLHDAKGRIHCSPTYKGHLANVNRYLR